MALEDVQIMADLLLKIAEQSLAEFPVGDLDNVNCWVATILSQPSKNGPAFRGIGMVQHDLQIGNFSFDLTCTECTSPDFDKLIWSLYNFNNATELEDAVRDQIEGVFESDFFPAFVDQVVEGAAKRCPHHSKYDPDAEPMAFLSAPANSLGLLSLMSSTANPSYFLAVNIVIATTLFACGFVAWLTVRQRNKKWVGSLDREGFILFVRQQDKERDMQANLDLETTSLLACPVIPRRVRYGVPAALLLNIILYLVGHLAVLSTVNIDATVAGEEFSINKFLEFKFIESTRDAYSNGGAEMAILLWIFTGIWPYVKLVGSLLLWSLPPSYLSVKRRGQLLLWIDALAKLSLIDIVTMLLGFAVLLVFIGGPDKALPYSETTLYAFKVIIVPKAGFYCLIIAQRMSRVSSRFLLEYHDFLIDDADKAKASDNQICECGSVESGSNCVEEVDQESSGSGSDEPRPDKDASNADQPKNEYRRGTMGVVFAACTIFVIFVIGCILAPAISLDTSSVAGLAAESGMTYEEFVNKYGVFLVMSSILFKARFVLDTNADYIGLGLLIVVGLVSAASLFFVQAYHFIKRKLREHRQGRDERLYGHRGCGLPFYLSLYKWRYMEIYLISVAVGVWQLGSACSYAIYSYCNVLWQIFSVMGVIGLVDESSAQCSRIQVSLPENILIIMASLLFLVAAFAFQASAQYKKNIADALRFVDEDDVPTLSLAWSADRSKNSPYSQTTVAMSIDDSSHEMRSVTLSPSSAATTPPATPVSHKFRLEARYMPSPLVQPSLSQDDGFETSPRRRAMPVAGMRRTTSVRFEEIDDGHDSHAPSPPRVTSFRNGSGNAVLRE